MKCRLLLCGAALLVAGCASQQNPFVSSAENSFTYDLVPQPVPDITPTEMDKLAPSTSPSVSPSGGLSQN
jgi:hypothetical protein